ncbi:MAG: Lrp/AsnC family transcriptional regulator [Leptolyngbyaceae cyanobacterium SM1_1_3]|nr:Lrp/AsnC family transcriptional regulator [Leptolyngbyaceae cyanobacterium SM1_1_3]NJO09509.1 Lrp/AsnC family transcriptional regulator [Leptolyngbyaceae cyanobacterium SL_1_1]
MTLSSLDYKAIAHLMTRAPITWAELASILKLSAPATADRVRRLEEQGVIQGYHAHIDPQKLGYPLTAFIAVTLNHPQGRAAFIQKVMDLPEVQECHHITGDDDYLLKVRCRSTQDLERLVSDELKSLSGVQKTRTTIVLSSVKESPLLPIPAIPV